ncbi:uncharacterized protein BP5553_09790 [Venustampulla echinocandica]|uniref:Uncharacterized protein n=1 Tax=Venustampulla echinocandica TaxID=2656787 RepID=A0A370TAN4_9HELO|nr:uncharacterized protein BP5553_09790 [Venustampulla echinocandica]RDL31001.1 hypothetical protein BP5553_09790 [Venustampulla echinocandica]
MPESTRMAGTRQEETASECETCPLPNAIYVPMVDLTLSPSATDWSWVMRFGICFAFEYTRVCEAANDVDDQIQAGNLEPRV